MSLGGQLPESCILESSRVKANRPVKERQLRAIPELAGRFFPHQESTRCEARLVR